MTGHFMKLFSEVNLGVKHTPYLFPTHFTTSKVTLQKPFSMGLMKCCQGPQAPPLVDTMARAEFPQTCKFPR